MKTTPAQWIHSQDDNSEQWELHRSRNGITTDGAVIAKFNPTGSWYLFLYGRNHIRSQHVAVCTDLEEAQATALEMLGPDADELLDQLTNAIATRQPEYVAIALRHRVTGVVPYADIRAAEFAGMIALSENQR